MNTHDEAGSHPVVPAAALLFQAPQFMEPVVKAPAVSREPLESSEAPPVEVSAAKKTTKGAKNSKSRTNVKKESASQDAVESAGESVAGQADSESPGPSKRRTKTTKPKAKLDAEIELPSGDEPAEEAKPETEGDSEGSLRRRRRRSRTTGAESSTDTDPSDQVTALKGSTRLEAKRMRRREGRKEGRKRQSISESEFLARRESVDREMVVRHLNGLDQIAVLEDGLLVEHYVARRTQQSIVGNIYLGRVQNVLPSMEAAFIDLGRGRNAVLYAGEVNWDALGMEGKPRRIETALKSGDTVLVQVTKDPIGHKGARLTSQITLAGRYLVLVPGSSMLGISRKLPDNERQRLKKVLREVVPENTGVIVRTAAEGASEEQLREDVERLDRQWSDIQKKQQGTKKAPQLLRGEPELVVRVVRDIFNEDFGKLVVQGEDTWQTVSEYVGELSPELNSRLEKWADKEDVFAAKRIEQQLSKGMDRKVWLPSGGTLVIDRTEALSVVDVNTGKFIGSGGTLEETVTRNNLEAAEEIVRQLRLRDIGGIIIIDFVDMVLESNRELVLRRLVECLGRDRTRHQVTEITSLGLVQMTRKRVGEGLVEAFSTTCEACEGRGFIVHDHPVELTIDSGPVNRRRKGRDDRQPTTQGKPAEKKAEGDEPSVSVSHVGEEKVKTALSAIAAATVTITGGAEVAPAKEAPKTTGRVQKKSERVAEEPVVEALVAEPTTEAVSQGQPPVVPRRRRVATSDGAMTGSTIAKTEKTEESVVEPAPKKKIEDITLPPAKSAADAKASAGPRRRKKVTSEDSPAKAVAPAVRARRRATSEVSEEKSQSAKEAVKDLFQA